MKFRGRCGVGAVRVALLRRVSRSRGSHIRGEKDEIVVGDDERDRWREDVPRPCPRRRSRRPRGKSRGGRCRPPVTRERERRGGTSRGQRAVQAGWRSVGISKPCSPTVEKEKIRAGERRTRRAFGRRDVVVRVARARKVSSGSRVVNETHLSGVEDVGVVGALDLLGALGGLEGDLVGHDGHAAGLGSDHGVLGAEGHAAGGEG